MAVQAIVEDARTFKACIDAVVNLVDEGTFEITSEGLHLRTMDPSQIAMVDFTLPKSAFSSLDIESPTKIGVNLADLSKILARSRGAEKLTISFDEREAKLLLDFVGESRRSFRLPLLDIGAAVPKEPKVAFDATVKIIGRAFKESLHDAGLLSSHVVLEVSEDALVVEAHGDAGDLKLETKKDSPAINDVKAGSKARALFPYEYLDDMTRACPDDAILELNLRSDAPVKVCYQIGEAKLVYYLAPRVESI